MLKDTDVGTKRDLKEAPQDQIFALGPRSAAVQHVRAAIGRTWPFALLCLINLATFWGQYVGRLTFPWDFIGGYHAQAFGWYAAGGMLHPPSWFPWTNLGFPAYIALQSGAWYLPLEFMHLAGIPYTIHVATVFQVLHVLFGAIGMYLLARRVGSSVCIALLVAAGYHFGAAFYSNEQNVDIVRAVAWIPWLLFVLHPTHADGKPWKTLVGALVLSQFLVAGYPGNVIAAIYACIVWVVMMGWLGRPNASRRTYVVNVAIIVMAGVLLAMPKWLPLLTHWSTSIAKDDALPAPFSWSMLLTALTPYDVKVLPSDVTMRSIWLPLTCMWGAVYIDRRDRLALTGIAFIAVSLVFGMYVRESLLLSRIFPGMTVSRFPLSDWRPILQVGLIFASIAGWSRVLHGECSQSRILFGTSLAFALGIIVLLLAIRVSFTSNELFRAILVLSLLTLMLMVFTAISLWNPGRARVTRAVMAFSLIGFTIIGGYQYQRSQPRTWRPKWNQQVSDQLFGVNATLAIDSYRGRTATTRRPERFVEGASSTVAIQRRKWPIYNVCWYNRTYCVFGYDNLKMSVPHRMFMTALNGPGGNLLFEYARRPQQLVALPIGSGNLLTELSRVAQDDNAPVVGDARSINVRFIKYSPSFVEYKITTPRVTRFVANEMWWPGWRVRTCTTPTLCGRYVNTDETTEGLRSWNLAAGSWLVQLKFFGPSSAPGYICALFGVLLALLWSPVCVRLWRRFRVAPAGGS